MLLAIAVPASAHYVNGEYRPDVTAEECPQIEGCTDAPDSDYQSGETSTQTGSDGSGGYSIPAYIVECESGGDYSARNPSGAGGAYQIMPSTWAAYGGEGDPASASKAEQDRIAAKIYAAEGTAPWDCG